MSDSFVDLLVVPEWLEHYIPYQHLSEQVERLADQYVHTSKEVHYRRRMSSTTDPKSKPTAADGSAVFIFRQDTAESFQGTLTMQQETNNLSMTATSLAQTNRGGNLSTGLNIHVSTKLTPTFSLDIQTVEWRVGRRGALHVEDALTMETMCRERSTDESSPLQNLALIAPMDPEQLGGYATRNIVLSLNTFNALVMDEIRPFVEKATKFYEAKAIEVSAISLGCSEEIKQWEGKI